MATTHHTKNKTTEEEKDFPGYPQYPASEDIYNNSTEEDLETDLLPSVEKPVPAFKRLKENVKDISEDESGDDLDVPGAELDDVDEFVGTEDEENNYYSLGGDDHNNLDEDKGE